MTNHYEEKENKLIDRKNIIYSIIEKTITEEIYNNKIYLFNNYLKSYEEFKNYNKKCVNNLDELNVSFILSMFDFLKNENLFIVDEEYFCELNINAVYFNIDKKFSFVNFRKNPKQTNIDNIIYNNLYEDIQLNKKDEYRKTVISFFNKVFDEYTFERYIDYAKFNNKKISKQFKKDQVKYINKLNYHSLYAFLILRESIKDFRIIYEHTNNDDFSDFFLYSFYFAPKGKLCLMNPR